MSPTIFAVAASPQVPACFCIQNLRYWSSVVLNPRRWSWDTSQFLFLSLCQCPSSAHLCYWTPSWCSPHPPSESPHSSGDPSVVFPLLLYHSGSLCHISTLIFLFFVSKPKLMSKLYQHIRIFRRVFYTSRSRKSQGQNIVYMSEEAKWPSMSKQESNCWAWSHQPEEAPAKSKTRSPISPLCLGLQWPVPQT